MRICRSNVISNICFLSKKMANKEGPDQARSWVIAMAGFVINSLLSGINRTNGMFYVALIDTYGVSRREANMPFTMRNVVRNLASPVAGIIGQRYGAQCVTIAGGVLASLGIGLCYFATNVTWITVLWGGMHGLGVSLGNTVFPMTINNYFLKYRATASGVSCSGACMGSLFPVALEYILRDFGMSGTFLICGGFLLHVLPAAILMTEPSWLKGERVIKGNVGNSERNTKLRSAAHTVEKIGNIGHSEVKNVNESISSLGITCDSQAKAETVLQTATRGVRNAIDNPAFVGSKTDISDPNTYLEEASLTILTNQKEFNQEVLMNTVSIDEVSLTVSQPTTSVDQERSLRKGIVKVIRDPMFHIISLSMAGFALIVDSILTVIVDYTKDKGLLEDDAKYFIIMLSLGDLLGRLGFGWVTDRNYMTLSKFMLLLQVVQGLCFLLLPLFYRFYILIIIFMIYGLTSGANLVMYPILVSKYLASVQSLAIGFIAVFTGLLSFAIPLLIGYFRDNAGSYNGMFVITGSLSIAAGCLWLLEPLFVRLQTSQSKVTKISS